MNALGNVVNVLSRTSTLATSPTNSWTAPILARMALETRDMRGKVRSGAISRILCSADLRRRRGSHSSRPRIAAGLKPPTRRLARAALSQRCRWRVCLFGVAPDGGCRVSRPHRLPGAYSSLWPCSSRHRARPLAVIPPYGVRTFLDARRAPRLPTPLRGVNYRGFTLC